MRIKANGGPLAVAVCLGLMATGCGASAKTTNMTVTKTVAETSGVQSEAVVHIYFCTADTCAREATRAQMSVVSRRASASPLVEKVVFLSKEEALRLLKEKYPGEVQALPSNPFPNRLTVIPKRPGDVEKVAALFNADPASGIDKVDYGR
jgi:cell division protein FtsX